MGEPVIQPSFAGGELAPSLHARVDLAKYAVGLHTCRNFFIAAHGGAYNRPGLRFVAEAKYSDRAIRLIPFSFSVLQTYVLEFGHLYMRVHKDGGQVLEVAKVVTAAAGAVLTVPGHGWSVGAELYVTGVTGLAGRNVRITATTTNTVTVEHLDGGTVSASGTGTAARVYEIATPYTENQLLNIRYTQSADVMTLCHTAHAPRELSRTDHAAWTLSVIDFAADISPPSSVTVTTSEAGSTAGGSVVASHSYEVKSDDGAGTLTVVPSVDATLDWTSPSPVSSVPWTGTSRTVTLSWAAVPGAVGYKVYRDSLEVQSSTATTYSETLTASASTEPDAASQRYEYVVTAEKDGQESVASAVSTVLSKKLGEAQGSSPPYTYATVTVTWAAVSGATAYHVYRRYGGTWGWIGSSDAADARELVDTNILPDTSRTPPKARNPFSGTGDYPQAVAFHQQRRIFAGSVNEPQTLWASKAAAYSNMDTSSPTRDDDAITVAIAASQVNEIRHLVPLTSLIALTSGGEWTISGGSNSEPLTPSSIQVKPQGYRGSATVAPLVIGNTVLFVQDKGAIVRDLGYSWEQDSYTGNDLSILANHLFAGKRVVDWAYAQAPHSIVWACRNDGALLGMTYMREHQVWAWHRHDSPDAEFRSVAVVSEGGEDAVYFAVLRTIAGRQVRTIERMESRTVTEVEDAFFVDCGLTYRGEPVSAVAGLWHLEGAEVVALADGNVVPARTVTGGTISLPRPASVVHVGLPYTSDLRTLQIELAQVGTIQGRKKVISGVTVRMEATRGLSVGPDEDRLTEMKVDPASYVDLLPLETGDYHFIIEPNWGTQASVLLRQSYPLPAGVMAVIPEIDIER